MTTSIFNASTEALPRETAAAPTVQTRTPTLVETRRTLAGRLIFVTLCAAIILSALVYGTVHYWALAVFQAGAAFIVVLWAIDAWRAGTLRVSRNKLQLALTGLFLLGLFQLLPFGSRSEADALPLAPASSISLDPYSTRLALIQILALLIYFAAALAFTDSSRRLRALVRTITIFGFLLAILGLLQSFTSPTKIYWMRELKQSLPFGPFFNRHHFAGYMELTLALPLGLLFSRAVERDKFPLYVFATVIMGIALVMTSSRGGIVSLVAEIFFLAGVAGLRQRGRAGEEDERRRGGRGRELAVRAGLGLGLVLVLLAGVLMLGGESALSRFVGSVDTDDPTTGRAHFWSVTLRIIRDHPLVGTGLGAYGVAYTRYDSHNGLLRVEQAHNDYLQVLSDAGLIGALLGVCFIVLLFRMGFARRESRDVFRSGVATGALAGCFAVLVHSFFDFTLHTTANALLFLTLAALATLNGRVEQDAGGRSRRGRNRRRAYSSSRGSGATRLAQTESDTQPERDALSAPEKQ